MDAKEPSRPDMMDSNGVGFSDKSRCLRDSVDGRDLGIQETNGTLYRRVLTGS